MKKITKSLLATLMLMVFSFNAFAVVDCEGLSTTKKATYKARSFAELNKELNSKSSEYSRCLKFNRNYPNANWDYVDKITGMKRIQGEQWDGVPRHKDIGNSSSNSYQKSKVEKLMTMDEIRNHKINPDTSQTDTDILVAKSLVKHLDLIRVFSESGGDGLRRVLYKENNLTGNHVANVAIYFWNRFYPDQISEMFQMTAKDFIAMNIPLKDVLKNNFSSKELVFAFSKIRKANPIKLVSR